MIFIFVSCIITLVTFILLQFLCFKYVKLRKLMSLYMTSPTAITDAMHTTSCRTNYIVYILSTICLLILTYAIIKLLIRGCRHFRRYQTTTHFLCENGHDDKGPSTAVALKLSTMSEITYVHITHLNIPITRLSVHETDTMLITLSQEIGFMNF